MVPRRGYFWRLVAGCLGAAGAALLAAGGPGGAARAAEPAGAGVSVRKDVAYYEGAGADAVRHRLDLYLPEKRKDFPLLLFIHGGAWRSGRKDLYGPLGTTFARQGIGVAAANYRLSPAVRHPEHIRDVARAFAWVAKNARELGANPRRLFASGHSAGGHLVALLALAPAYLKAEGADPGAIRGVVGISGPYSLAPGLFREVFGEDEAARGEAFPLTHVKNLDGKKAPRFLLLYADQDYPGLPQSARMLQAALSRQGASSSEAEIRERDHISIIVRMSQPDDDAGRRVAAFVREGE